MSLKQAILRRAFRQNTGRLTIGSQPAGSEATRHHQSGQGADADGPFLARQMGDYCSGVSRRALLLHRRLDEHVVGELPRIIGRGFRPWPMVLVGDVR